MSVRVAFDMTAAPEQPTGAANYMRGLVAALGRRDDVDLEVMSAHRFLRSRPVRLLWEQTVLPRRMATRRPDLLHSPHYTMPVLCPVPVVVTFHDATFFTHPRLHQPVKVAFFRSAMRVSARRAAAIVAVSESTAEAVIRHTGVGAERVHVVHEGVDLDAFRPPDEEEVARFRDRYRIHGPFVAFLATIEPRKNVPRLIEAFRRVDWDGQLVIAGRAGWGQPLTDALPPRVRRIGYIADDERRALLGGADAVCYPSIAEGFGLPVLEAMACGAAVVTSDRSATAEVAGAAGVLVDPLDVSSIAAGLERALAGQIDRDAARRRAQQFTWARAAAETAAVYHSAVSHRVEGRA